ncbi:MAG: potassium-transporting ATPase subunit KdpA [Candidatus Nitrosopolaris sp.]
MNSIAELIVVLGGTIGLSIPFGLYIARMISYEMRPLEAPLARVENGFYKIIGIDKNKQMTWKEYSLALMLTNVIVGAFIFFMLVFQNVLPSSTHVSGLPIDLAFMQAISFITNTDLQHYAGDQSFSVISQMVVLTFTMFVAPASGIAAAFAFIRGFIRKNYGLGNFYVDFIRIILTLLLPVAFGSALLLMVLGVPQTLNSSVTINHTLEGHNQTFVTGPVASLESIKELGSNGGGYYGANSGHPFENPNGLSNMYEIFLMLIIPLSFPIAYAKLVGKARGVSLLLAILIAFGILLAIAFSQVSGPTGLETRFGSFGSEFFNTASISTNTGSANSALSGMSPNPVISFLLGMFVQSIPGADGTGMMYMIIYVILTLFIVGLMVGKTPEFMNMKIGPRDIMIAAFIFLIHPASILIPTVIAFTTGNAQSVLSVPAGKMTTASGFNQALYEYTSTSANNGSDYLGTSANTPFWNWSTAIVMFIGRYAPIVMMLAIAGSFTLKDRKEAVEPIKTHGPLFISVLLVMTFLLTALTFFPFIVIGPFSM